MQKYIDNQLYKDFPAEPEIATLCMYSLAIRMAAVAFSSDVYPRNVAISALTSRNVEAASGLVEAWTQVPDDNAPPTTDQVAAAGIFLRSLCALASSCPKLLNLELKDDSDFGEPLVDNQLLIVYVSDKSSKGSTGFTHCSNSSVVV